jgi:uncharacterized protein (TIGR02246 family)
MKDTLTEDEHAIHDVVTRLENTWNAGDSVAYAALFAEDANFIHIFGGQLDGRTAIQESHRHIFATIYRGSQVRITAQNIRFVREDVAIVFNRAQLKFHEGQEARELETRPTMVVAKGGDGWQIVAFQNTRVSDVVPS